MPGLGLDRSLSVQKRLISCVGDDNLSALVARAADPGRSRRRARREYGGRPGSRSAVESPARDHTFLSYLGVNARSDPTTIPDEALDCVDLLLCDYFVGTDPAQLDGATAARYRPRQGRPYFLRHQLGPDGFPGQTGAEVYELLPFVDVFLPNEVEACALADGAGDATRAARALRSVSRGWVVVKLGPSGCWRSGRRDRARRPSGGGQRRRHNRGRRRVQRRSGACARPPSGLARCARERDPVRDHHRLPAVQQRFRSGGGFRLPARPDAARRFASCSLAVAVEADLKYATISHASEVAGQPAAHDAVARMLARCRETTLTVVAAPKRLQPPARATAEPRGRWPPSTVAARCAECELVLAGEAGVSRSARVRAAQRAKAPRPAPNVSRFPAYDQHCAAHATSRRAPVHVQRVLTTVSTSPSTETPASPP